MADRRLDFQRRYDWIRRSLCFEPRGHDMMSGGFLYPPTLEAADIGIIFIETSGCLPMCGHGTIGLVTLGLEHGLIEPREPGHLVIEVPAGTIDVDYTETAGRVTSVRITNVPSYVAAEGIEIDVPGLGPLVIDVAYGGNFYAIIEPQGGYRGLDSLNVLDLIGYSRTVRQLVREKFKPVHPLAPSIREVSHVLWADHPKGDGADGRSAVFYGDCAIDRSPCGTGTSARMAHLVARRRLKKGDRFVHESYIGSRFIGTVEAVTTLGGHPAIVPSIEGSAVATGFNTIWIDDTDPFWQGFQVT